MVVGPHGGPSQIDKVTNTLYIFCIIHLMGLWTFAYRILEAYTLPFSSPEQQVSLTKACRHPFDIDIAFMDSSWAKRELVRWGVDAVNSRRPGFANVLKY